MCQREVQPVRGVPVATTNGKQMRDSRKEPGKEEDPSD